MADDRVLPPSPRRIALARRAGLVPRSATLVAGAAWAGAVIGLWLAAGRARTALSETFRAAAAATTGDASTASLGAATTAAAGDAPTSSLRVADVVGTIAGLVAPLLVGALAGALALHLAQTRALAIPRRDVTGAPRPGRGLDRRAADAGLRGARAGLVAAVALGWTWAHLEDLGELAGLAPVTAVAGAGALAISALAHLAAALLVAGALDLGVAVLRHRADLRMTRTEAADDARAAGLDPRWRRERATAGRDPTAAAVRSARAVVSGDGAVAIRYHARLWPRPTVVAAGRGVDAFRLIELARRHRVPIDHAPEVARALAPVRPGEPVPDAVLPALAELLAAADG